MLRQQAMGSVAQGESRAHAGASAGRSAASQPQLGLAQHRSLQRLRAALELLKPVTWFAPMWALACGVVSAGVPVLEHWASIVGSIVLAGPLVCGTSQAANDWFDRHVDAINEPQRPIPSGRMPGRSGLYLALIWTALSLGVAALLGFWVLMAACFGLALAWAYSAPPFRLKMNGIWGCSAVGLCYEGLPWFTGAAALSEQLPDARIVALAFLYSAGAFGIMVLNDFKAIEGDRALGIRTLPVQLGVRRAALSACVVMAVPQLFVIALLLRSARPYEALAVSVLVVMQLGFMRSWIRDPRGRAPFYNMTGVSSYVTGMMISAFAMRALSSIHVP